MWKNKIYYAFIIFSFLSAHYDILIAQPPEKTLETFRDSSFLTKPDLIKWNQLKANFMLSAASINDRVVYNQYPFLNSETSVSAEAWTGETVNVQIVVSTKKNIPALQVSAGNFTSLNGSKIIDRQNISIGYVYYVIADNTPGVCHKINYPYKILIVPDIIDFNSKSSFAEGYTNRPVWINIKVPADANPGIYKGIIIASGNQSSQSIPVMLTVKQKAMPDFLKRKFFLNLWQYPLTEADYYNVKPWSDEHFTVIKPAMLRLKDAGQQVITTSFFWDIYNSKVRSADDMMVKVIKNKSGTWNYDFTNFDKWVNFMMGLGINKQIECFGMAPLNYRYYYLDDSDNTIKSFSEGVNGKNYIPFWKSYLSAFEQHLKEKNWFSITTIGIDEKEQSVLVPLIKLIKGVDANWKISFTGKYFPDLQNNIYDYSVISNQAIPAETIVQRKQKNYITTYYTSCWEIFPNTFTMSAPSDATWLGWNAAYRNLDGYLRYAYDYFGKNFLTDVRSNVASGDNSLIYPANYSSIRFEMLKDGIEDFEKIRLKQNSSNLSAPQLNSLLSQFDFHKVNARINRFDQIKNARAALNN